MPILKQAQQWPFRCARRRVAYEPDMNVDKQLRKFDHAIGLAHDSGDHDQADYLAHLREHMLSEAGEGRPQPFSHYYPAVQEEYGERAVL